MVAALGGAGLYFGTDPIYLSLVGRWLFGKSEEAD
jgi:hypothetical protein